MPNIHPTAIIHESATIDPTAKVGAYCMVGEQVSIGANTVLRSHVVVARFTRIGSGNDIFQFASIGEDCQDLKYAGEETWLEIGDNNRIREGCTIHRGTIQDSGLTKIGDDNLLMVNSHIAHDCVVGSHNVIANNVAVAGHVHIGNHIIIGGNAGIHQFCQVDDFSLIGGGSVVLKDVMAMTTVSGNPAKTHGLNLEGMRRKGWSKVTIQSLREAYKLIFRSGLTSQQAISHLQQDLLPTEPKVQLLIDSLINSKRGIVR